MISFENTEIAFKSKSNRDLQKAYWLFKIVGNSSLVKIGKVATNFALKIGLPIKGIIKKTIFSQFCGGESIKKSISTSDDLAKHNVKTILDYSIEGKTSDEDFDATVNEIIATIDEAKNNSNIPFAVFKVTGICLFSVLEKANEGIEKLDESTLDKYNQMVERVDRICKASFDSNVPLFIDAEETWIQDTIDQVATEMMVKYNQNAPLIYNTLQMYRHDRLAYLGQSIDSAREKGYFYAVKIVRGAYMEKERNRAEEKGYPSPIQPDKKSCDKDYNSALEIALENLDIVAICAGTHNEESALRLAKMIEDKGVSPNDSRIYFAQLLGMSDHISFNIANAGFNVAKYVPYGPVKEVMPYLLRRADENTSVAGQTGRELSLIMKERKRRKGK